MKKLFAILLILAMTVSLAACGDAKKAEEEVKPETPIAEPEVTVVVEETPEVKEEPAPKAIKEIEITTEIFSDYFELATVADYDHAEKDGDGNITVLTVYYDYVLKDGIEVAVDKAEDCKVAADFDVKVIDCMNAEGIDYEALTYESAEVETEQVWTSSSADANWWKDRTLCEGDAGYDGAEYKLTLLELTVSPERLQSFVSADLNSASGTIFIFE